MSSPSKLGDEGLSTGPLTGTEDEVAILERQRCMRESIQPSTFANLFVNHTKKTCAVSCLIPVLAVVIIIATGALSIDNPEGREYYVRNDVRTRLADARSALRDELKYTENTTDTEVEVLPQSESEGELTITILLRGKNNGSGSVSSYQDFEDSFNILNRDSIALHKKAEDSIINHRNYSSFCLKDREILDCNNNTVECSFPDSYLNHPTLYGVYVNDSEGNPRLCGRKPGHELVSEKDFDAFVKSLLGSDPLRLRNFFDSNLTAENPKAWAAKSTIYIGLPLNGYTSPDDQNEQQIEEYIKWTDNSTSSINDDLSNNNNDVLPISESIANNLFGSVVLRDLAFSVLAIILVFIVIWAHTSSFFLGSVAMLQIFLAFPLTFVVYHFIFRQLYFAALQILTVFLLLGIGADDVFVFTDAWKQAAVVLGPDVDLMKRMTWTYKRAVRAMTVTSLTTAAAFFVTASSPIMPISTLGVWAGTLILLQFVLVITIYPCATIMWHRFWRPRMFVRCFKKPPPEEIEREVATPLWHRFLPKSKRPEVRSRTVGEYRFIERFFRGTWFNIIRRIRLILIVIAFCLAAVAIWLASTLEPPEETENFLPEDHPVRNALTNLREAFPRSDSDLQLKVRIVWGIKDVDRTGTSKFNVRESGKPILDEDFEMRKKEVQQHIFDTCSFVEKEKSDLLFQLDTGIQSVRCWIRDYADWRVNVRNTTRFETFTTDKGLVDDLIEFGEYQRPDKTKPYLTHLMRQNVIFNENRTKVVYTEVSFVSDEEALSPVKRMWPVYEKWVEVLDTVNSDGPTGGNKAIVTSGAPWVYSVTQRTLIRSMIVGISVMIVVALFTLIAATLNWMVAILATLSIGGVVAMLLGGIRLYGWTLGISESIGVVIGVGYSFDGVAHVATAYVESKSKTRADRTRDALTDLGISVLFGAITTLLAGICLLPAIIIFFVKFAGLIITTIVLSLLWSLVFFPSLLLTAGPENDFGDLRPLFARCFRRKQNSTTPAENSDNLWKPDDNGEISKPTDQL